MCYNILLFFYLKNYHDICCRLKIIYKLFPNSDLMVMREFYILNEILIFKYQNMLIFISKWESK